MTILGCIADDFTGASDLAGLLARSGVQVSLRLGVPETPPQNTAPFEVIALKCRTSPVEDATLECLAALEWLQQAGAKRFYWKYCSTFDSTAEGNIGPVAEALMASLNTAQTIYCPAFPENGRSIYMGNLFVGDELLHESPMKDHPLTPMRDSNLMRLLTPQVSSPVGLANRLTVAKGVEALRHRLDQLSDEGIAHVIVDAVADQDLDTIAEATIDMPLITGGSALAMPLPDLYKAQGLLTKDAPIMALPKTDDAAIVLSGSCSAMTRRQVAAFKTGHPSYQLSPQALVNGGIDDAVAWLKSQDLSSTPMVYATAEPEQVKDIQDQFGVSQSGTMIEDAMARLAQLAFELGYRRFVVAGGETSGAVAQALAITAVTIGREITPGVPWVFAEKQDQPFQLAMKSGNFGLDDFFSKALQMA